MKLTELNNFSALFKDYVAHFSTGVLPRYFQFAPGVFSAEYEAFLKARVEKWQKNSELQTAVCRMLREQYESRGIQDESVERSIKALGEPGAVAVLTGQQVAIFGGPLYTIYKAATAVSLAGSLKKRYPAYNFIPIFWLETEDHDIEESASTHVLDRDFGIKNIRYEPSGLGDPLTPNVKPWRRQVGPLALEQEPLDRAFAELTESLAGSEFTDRMLGELSKCYAAGSTFAHSFAKLMQKRFMGDGLLTIDANNHTAKFLAKHLFSKELQTSPALSERIILQTAELEERYHGQVKPRALNLFYLEAGERFALTEKEGLPEGAERAFFLQGTKRTFTLTELLAQVENAPERFSPNVVMRPLYQDTLLPTVAYVGGPGEIAYFAQFRSAYEWAGLTMPMIVPRVTATIVDDRFEKLLQKSGLEAGDILRRGREGVKKHLETLSDATLAPKFEDAAEQIDRAIESLRAAVERTDATLSDALTTLKGKTLTQVRDFLAKTLAADRKRFAEVKAKFEKLLNAVLPHEVLQERELSALYFLNKYGPEFWDKLKGRIRAQTLTMDEHLILSTSELLPQKSDGTAGEARTSTAPKPLVAIPAEENATMS